MQTFINFQLLNKSSRTDKMGKESTQCIENVGKVTAKDLYECVWY